VILRRLEDLASLIRGRREALDITQQQLADRVDVQRGVIVRIEKADPGVAVGTIYRVLRALDIDLSYERDDVPAAAAKAARPSVKRPRIDINTIVDGDE